MKKIIAVFLMFSIMLGTAPVKAMNIPEGAVIKTSDNPDVYIVKYMNGKNFKRLVLNPQVFASYGHLKWENILTVDQSAMDSFSNSDLVRVDGQTAVYRLVPDGDTGSKTLISNTGTLDGDSIYTINSVDFGNYTETTTNTEISGPYNVYKVIDGDTLSATINGINQTIRLIGIDSPEVTSPYTAAECYGNEASAIVKEKLTGKRVRLKADPVSGDKDKYGRLLRYVYLEDGTLFNQWLVAEGYAKEYTYNNIAYKYQSQFKAAQAAAASAKKGLWGVEVCALSDNFFANAKYVCTGNIYNCSDFKTQAEAQAAYAYCMNQTGKDIHELDSDGDGTVCEGLK